MRGGVIRQAVVLTTVALAVAWTCFAFQSNGGSSHPRRDTVAAGSDAANSRQSAEREAAPASGAPTPSQKLDAAAVDRKPSLAAELDRLIKSGSPKAAYEVAMRLDACRANRHLPQGVPANGGQRDVDEICGDISAGQMTLQSRLAAKAAKAGIAGAAVIFAGTSPDGRPNGEVWGDPAYGEWKNEALHYLTESGRAGDLESIAFLQRAHMRGVMGDDRSEAAMYFSAYTEAMKAKEPFKSNETARAEMESRRIEQFGLLTKGVAPDQVSKAAARGRSFIAGHRD